MWEKVKRKCKEIKPNNSKNLIDALTESVSFCYSFYDIKNKETYLQRVLERWKNISTANSIEDFENTFIHKYKLEKSTTFKNEISTFVYLIGYICYDVKLNNSILDSVKNNTEFLTRCYIRLSLLQHNWNIHSIEKLLNKKKKYIEFETPDKNFCEITYIFIKNLLELQEVAQSEKNKGRPRIPDELSVIISEYNKTINRNRMAKIYNFYILFKKDEIIELINTTNNSQIKSKLEKALSLL